MKFESKHNYYKDIHSRKCDFFWKILQWNLIKNTIATRILIHLRKRIGKCQQYVLTIVQFVFLGTSYFLAGYSNGEDMGKAGWKKIEKIET